jgi:very-short-patch-repair endonuclease
MDLPPALTAVLRAQDGVVNRRQLRELGLSKPQVETLLRRRSLTAVHPGVYVDHTGTPTYAQRCWAAALYAEPAALAGRHALPEPPTSPGEPIEVAIDWSRRVGTRRGIRITRMRDLDDHVAWNRSPPRLHLETAAIVGADRARTDHEAIALLCELVGSRRTTASRLASSLAERPRHSRRQLVAALVDDLAAGTHSVLEHGLLERVLRPHRLPVPTRHQAPERGRRGREYRDMLFEDLGAHLELDGGHHDGSAQKDDDADRDLQDIAGGLVVPRLRYAQVFGWPCRTARLLAGFFALRGWADSARPCSPGCEVGSGSPGSP